MGMIVEGDVEITIDGVKKLCKQGDLYHIPSNIQHSFKVISQPTVKLLDIFSPPKKENIID